MKKEKDAKELAEIVGEILAYLADHPDAQDTLEGITEWWLLERTIKRQSRLVEMALEHLIDKGLVIEIRGMAPLPTYKINKTRQGSGWPSGRRYPTS